LKHLVSLLATITLSVPITLIFQTRFNLNFLTLLYLNFIKLP